MYVNPINGYISTDKLPSYSKFVEYDQSLQVTGLELNIAKLMEESESSKTFSEVQRTLRSWKESKEGQEWYRQIVQKKAQDWSNYYRSGML